MMRRKNLERAVILGLLLSTSVYGSAWADKTYTISDFRNLGTEISVNENTTVEGTGTSIGGDEVNNTIVGKVITVGDGVVLNLNNLAGNHMNIKGNGDINITLEHNAGANGGAIYMNGDITANKLSIDTSATSATKGIYTYGGDVNIDVNELSIKANSHGIFTTGDATSDVIINDTQKVIIETNGAHGIVNSGNTSHVNNISIKSDKENSLVDIFSHTAGVSNNNSGGGVIDLKADTVKVVTDNLYAVRGDHGDIMLNAKNNIVTGGTSGVHAGKGNITVTALENNIIGIDDANEAYQSNYNTYDHGAVYGYTLGDVSGDIDITAGNNNIVQSYKTGIHNRGIGTITLIAGNNYSGINVLSNDELTLSNIVQTGTDGINVESGEVILEAQQGINQIDAGLTGIKVTKGNVNLSAQNNFITANSVGVSVIGKDSYATLDSKANYISAVNEEAGDVTGVEVKDEGNFNLSKKDGYVTETVDIEAITNNGNATGVSLDKAILKTDPALNTLNITAASKNLENNKVIGISLDNASSFDAQAGTISILAGQDNSVFGAGEAINALNGSSVNLNANNNEITGAVYAEGDKTSVTLSGFNGNSNPNNHVYSAAVIENAGDLAGKEVNGDVVTGMDVVSALYAEEGANINLSGVNNIQTYYGDTNDEHTSERAVWAYKGANITLDGVTNISTYKYEVSPEDKDIAIAAGTATELDKDDFTEEALSKVEMANVNLNYQAGSTITGDILAAYGGEVHITDANPATLSAARSGAATGIAITGNLLAGNTGKLTVDLGKGGSLTGRADDYGDASTEHITLYNPAFSSNIIQGGDVTLNMGDESRWNVQGQSWITNVNTNGNVTIDLTSAENEYQKYNSHALTIRNLNGDANIKMNLNGDRSASDMLYIGQGKGEYNIELAKLVRVSDMYADLDENTKFSGLRFATVGAGSDVKFNVTAKGQGFNNVVYTVDTDVYNSAESKHENDAYNGENMSEEKPGNSLVEDLLNGKETETPAAKNAVATLAANDVMLLADEAETVNENEDNHLNYKLVDMKADGLTDAGKTMLNMSRANYSNAIYMDRLNKRLGEARYINDDPEEDEGMWVRIRHDRIGKEDAFRSQNTMYELGYDKRQDCDNGKRRVGFAVDYMHGDTGYSDIAGKGEIDRYGLWLYDTWTGNKGHYADYVAKWGHLQNDFEVYTMTGGEKVTGDYSNNVFSISAEYGRKKDMGNDWYIEPQAQLQLARVTGADYTTSQGTKVSVDGINSLIGRAGFRLGKDFGEEKQSTVYFKADVLHEFLGDQTIRAMDGTTDGWQTVDYENKGTWYDIGIGYAAMLSQSTYAFIDLEQSFGNDNDDTYQINAGVRWTF